MYMNIILPPALLHSHSPLDFATMSPLLLLVLLSHAALVLAQAAGSTLSIYSPSSSVWCEWR